MRSFAIIGLVAAVVSTVQGFAPQGSAGRVAPSTELQASLLDAISGMDLFAPKKDQNTYGARKNKNLSIGKIKEGKSYVPSGLTAAQYSDIRKGQQKRKEENYQRNVAKAGIFEDYTDFYIKRGTDTGQAWAKNKNTLGHRFAKTKYDWAGNKGQNFGSTTASQVGKGKKSAAAKKKGKNPFTFGKKK